MSRFVVATCSGYMTDAEWHPGLSAHVLDTLNAHRVVAVFRGVDREGRSNTSAVARREADLEAARLNRLEAFAA